MEQPKLVEKDGQWYLVSGDKAVPVRIIDGKPVVEGAWGEYRKNAQGGTDCIMHVPCLTIVGEVKPPGGN
jgi:hypothetical protein